MLFIAHNYYNFSCKDTEIIGDEVPLAAFIQD